MTIKQISVFIENTPGSLQAMTGVLADHNIDMRALSLAETEDFGIARIIVDDVFTAEKINVDYMYAFMGGKETAHAYMIFRVNDPIAAAAALNSRGIKLVRQDEMTNL